jgi:hypothetical protein
MKRYVVVALVVIPLLLSCVSNEGSLDEFYFLHGATLERGPLGFTLTSPDVNALALREVGPYTEQVACEVTLQAQEGADRKNGFLVLADRGDPGGTVLAGVHIGGGEYAIWGSGVSEPVSVAADFDRNAVFEVQVLLDLVGRFVRMRVGGREFTAGLAESVTAIDVVGYNAESTTTHFSAIHVNGR